MNHDFSSQFPGEWMHELAHELWPLHRSITGEGLRKTLQILKRELSDLSITEIPTGTQVFDWIVPPEWVIRSGTITDPHGDVVVDYADNNLHVMGYAESVNEVLSLDELQGYLHSIPDQPNAIPFVTSYYNRTWGFCLTHDQRSELQPGDYRVMIDSEFHDGSLTLADLVIPGDSTDEIMVSTYVCHPSLANNELSGPVVAVALAKYIQSLPKHHYTYRFVFAPETIGAICYASQHLRQLQENTVAAFNLTCIGDDRAYTYLASRQGNLRVDRIAKRIVSAKKNSRTYSYLERGSDERHYGAPGVDLPMVSLMRSRYGDYPEYHTSLDDLVHVVTPSGLQGGFDLVRECFETLETEQVLVAQQLAEPQLGRRGLYHTTQKKSTPSDVMLRTNILAYADGQHSIVDMCELFGSPRAEIEALVNELLENNLLAQQFQQPPTKSLGALSGLP
jgi:aminopeptidase-like protein